TEAFGPHQHLYQATAMVVSFFVVVPAVIQHRRAKAIDQSALGRLVPPALAAVVIGVYLSELPIFRGAGEARLRMLFGVFVLTVAVVDLYRLFRPLQEPLPPVDRQNGPEDRLSLKAALSIAVPTGLVAGLLGVGGGLLAVPLQRRLLRVPLRRAIANSAALIIATSGLGAIVKNHAYMTAPGGDLKPAAFALLLAPSAMIGSLIGSYLTHRLRLRTVKAAFFLLLVVAGIRLCAGASVASAVLDRKVLRVPRPSWGVELQAQETRGGSGAEPVVLLPHGAESDTVITGDRAGVVRKDDERDADRSKVIDRLAEQSSHQDLSPAATAKSGTDQDVSQPDVTRFGPHGVDLAVAEKAARSLIGQHPRFPFRPLPGDDLVHGKRGIRGRRDPSKEAVVLDPRHDVRRMGRLKRDEGATRDRGGDIRHRHHRALSSSRRSERRPSIGPPDTLSSLSGERLKRRLFGDRDRRKRLPKSWNGMVGMTGRGVPGHRTR
ncbi:MAG: sulfite exporter TauE/SafE family protein, partial [Planctomycetota bacterium]